MSAKGNDEIAAIDARLSAWGQYARNGLAHRAETLISACIHFTTGKSALRIASRHVSVDTRGNLLLRDLLMGGQLLTPRGNGEIPGACVELARLAAAVLPGAAARSKRLLVVDETKLIEALGEELAPIAVSAREEIRRVQALLRRRARLWCAEARLEIAWEQVRDLWIPPTGVAAEVARELEKL